MQMVAKAFESNRGKEMRIVGTGKSSACDSMAFSDDAMAGPAPMAAEAARMALKNAGLTPEDLDLILVGRNTGRTQPPLAALVRAQLGLGPADVPARDVKAVGFGFVQALDLAAGRVRFGAAKHVLIVTAEIAPVGDGWDEAGMEPGAAAVVLGAGEHEWRAPASRIGGMAVHV